MSGHEESASSGADDHDENDEKHAAGIGALAGNEPREAQTAQGDQGQKVKLSRQILVAFRAVACRPLRWFGRNSVAISAVFTAAFTGLLVWTSWKMWDRTGEQINIATQTLETSYPPILRVRRFSVDGFPDEIPTPQKVASGRFHVANIGNNDAEFVGAWCEAKWRVGHMPMQPPYSGRYDIPYGEDCRIDDNPDGDDPNGYFVWEGNEVVTPGRWGRVLWTAEPDTGLLPDAAKLFVCGWVDYSLRDQRQRRRTAFCRYFDPADAERPWFQIYTENPDYEFEDGAGK